MPFSPYDDIILGNSLAEFGNIKAASFSPTLRNTLWRVLGSAAGFGRQNVNRSDTYMQASVRHRNLVLQNSTPTFVHSNLQSHAGNMRELTSCIRLGVA